MLSRRWTRLLIFLTLTGCLSDTTTHFPGSGPPADQDLSYAGFEVDTISGTTILDSTRVETPYDLAVSGGRLFVLERFPPPVLRAVRIGTWEVEDERGRRGEGPGEVAAPWQVIVAPNGEPWIYDTRQERLVRLHRIDSATGALAGDEETITLRGSGAPIMSMKWLTDTTFVAYGLFHSERFGLFSVDGALLKEFGGVPEGPEAILVPFRNQYSEVEIAVHPSRQIFAAAMKNTGVIEIFDFTGERQVLVRTPFDFRSSFTFTSTRQGRALGWNSDWRRGYIDVVATEDQIFALFSGRSLKRYGSDAAYGRYVHIFDWDGELQRILRLDMDAFKIAVEPDGSAIYTASNDGLIPVVRRYELSSPGVRMARSD